MELTIDAVAEAIHQNWPQARVTQPDEGVVFGITGDHSSSLLHIMPVQTPLEPPERLGLQLWADFFYPDGHDMDWAAYGWHRSLEHCHFINDALDWCTLRVQHEPKESPAIRPLLNRAVPVFGQDIVYAYEGDPGSSLLLGIIDMIREWNLIDPIIQAIGNGSLHDCTHIDRVLHTSDASSC